MNADFFPLIAVVIVLAVFAGRYFLRAKKKEELRKVAAMLGLEYVDAANDLREKVGEALQNSQLAGMADSALQNSAGMASVTKIMMLFTPWEMHGRMNSVRVVVREFTRGKGRNKRTYTRMEALFEKPFEFEFHAGTETFLSKIGQTLGGRKDIQVGASVFNGAIRVQSNWETQVVPLLSRPEIQQEILQLVQSNDSAYVDHQGVHMDFRGTVSTFEKIRSSLEMLSRTASFFETARRFS
jgi:hypothetical protein